MASINIAESDFDVLADATMAALDRGDREAAQALDKLARKANAALTNQRTAARMGGQRAARMFGHAAPIKWTDVPSVIATRPRV